jgi:hypothetical protein
LTLGLGFERAQALQQQRFGSRPAHSLDLSPFRLDLAINLFSMIVVIGERRVHFRQRVRYEYCRTISSADQPRPW